MSDTAHTPICTQTIFGDTPSRKTAKANQGLLAGHDLTSRKHSLVPTNAVRNRLI